MLMRAPLLSWVITVKWMEFQKSLLDTWKVFSRFPNTLTTGGNYSLVSRDNWMQTIQMHFSQKEKIFSEFFIAFFEFALNFEYFRKKMPSELMYFPNYRPLRTWLDKCVKGPVWEEPSTCAMVNGPKHWLNLNESAFISLSDHCERNLVANVILRDVKIL